MTTISACIITKGEATLEAAIASVRPHVDEVVVIETPAGFSAVGQFYQRFGQTEDAEVSALLAEASSRTLGR